jgi:hypothetical protein
MILPSHSACGESPRLEEGIVLHPGVFTVIRIRKYKTCDAYGGDKIAYKIFVRKSCGKKNTSKTQRPLEGNIKIDLRGNRL